MAKGSIKLQQEAASSFCSIGYEPDLRSSVRQPKGPGFESSWRDSVTAGKCRSRKTLEAELGLARAVSPTEAERERSSERSRFGFRGLLK
jgi:hypothetical protein